MIIFIIIYFLLKEISLPSQLPGDGRREAAPRPGHGGVLRPGQGGRLPPTQDGHEHRLEPLLQEREEEHGGCRGWC